MKCLLNQNIGRAFRVNSGLSDTGRWVWEVCVKREFVETMVWDRTNFHGFTFGVEYEEYVDEKKSVEHFNLEK